MKLDIMLILLFSSSLIAATLAFAFVNVALRRNEDKIEQVHKLVDQQKVYLIKTLKAAGIVSEKD